MRDAVRRDQFTLFGELVETVTTRDHVNDAGMFVRPPPGRGWRVLDAMTAATANSTAQTCEAG